MIGLGSPAFPPWAVSFPAALSGALFPPVRAEDSVLVAVAVAQPRVVCSAPPTTRTRVLRWLLCIAEHGQTHEQTYNRSKSNSTHNVLSSANGRGTEKSDAGALDLEAVKCHFFGSSEESAKASVIKGRGSTRPGLCEYNLRQ